MHSLRTAALVGAALAIVGCGTQGARTDYANDGDTGAAAPATVIDTARTRNVGDSTQSPNLPQASGRKGVAGDTTRGRDSTRK